MSYLFKCKNCGHKFASESDNYVQCPNCESDNVEPVKKSPLKLVLPLLAVVIVAGATFYAIQYVKNGSTEKESAAAVKTGTTASTVENGQTTDTVATTPKLVEPVVINKSTPVLKKGKYSFLASCINVPAGVKVKFVLKDFYGTKTVMESMTGNFTDVPASKDEGGAYKIVVLDANSGTELAETFIDGLIKEVVKIKKMTKDELQSLINSQSTQLLGYHKQIDKNVKLYFDNLNDGELTPKNLSDINDKLTFGDWESVTVTSVEYNDPGQIKKVIIHIQHADF